MKTNYLSKYLLIIFFFLSITSLAQSRKLLKADKKFASYKYIKAIGLYSSIARNNYKTTSENYVTGKIGDCYRFINNTKTAEEWYAKAVNSPGVESIYYFQYSQMLKSNGKYPEAKIWMQKYLESNPEDVEAIKILAYFERYDRLMKDSLTYKIKYQKISSDVADFSPAFYGDSTIIFVSSRDTTSTRVSAWTEEPFYNLYTARINQNNDLSNVNELKGEIVSRFHEGPLTFSKTEDRIYFTRSNYYKKKRHESKDNINYLKIYTAKVVEGKWQDVQQFQYNNDEYSVAHPTISSDGTKLYFTSKMPGGVGGMDIYVCQKLDSGWSEPKNMGKPINTASNELFPFIADDGTLYFASNGHPGLGSLDVFSYQNNKITNLGYPINTRFDDLGLIINPQNKGYFSSNRKDGLLNDDIYFFRKNNPPVAQNDEIKAEISYSGDAKPLTINILNNDSDIDNDLVIQQTKLLTNQTQNSISLDSIGNFFYTPVKGYKGIETFTYAIFDENQASDTATITVKIVGKTPPVAVRDTLTVDKNTKNHIISVMKNDSDADNDLDMKSLKIITNSPNGSTAVVEGETINYSPAKEFTGNDYLVYQITDQSGLKDADTVAIKVQMKFMGKVVTKNLEINLVINFNSGKWDITKEAAKVLDSLVNILNENPTVEIEMGAHTDSRGSATANQSLSQKRAESTVAYLTKQGIAASRLSAKGYGESQLLNRCADGVPCKPEEHAINRRTVIKILKF